MKNLYFSLLFVLLTLLAGGKTCLAATADDLNRNFLDSASKGDLAKVTSLLSEGAQLSTVNETNRNALILAAEAGHLNVVGFLLEKGINENARAARGRTALIQAAKMGHVEIVKILLEHGADLNAKTNKGRTALNQASKRGYSDVVKVLLDHGSVNLDAVRSNGMTSLMMAAELGDIKTVEMLIAKGANISVKNKEGKTAFDFAEKEEVKKLLQEK